MLHVPVMPQEILGMLALEPGMVVLDATLGFGGHAKTILDIIGTGGYLIGIDTDEEALRAAEKTLSDFKGRFNLVCDNFANLDGTLMRLNIKKLDACLFDLGVSSMQLERAERGFSIKYDGPLDMRMDRRSSITAAALVNNLSEINLVDILRKFGEERFSKSIAKGIVRQRSKEEINTTWVLARVVAGSVPRRFRHARIHPATRTFQALRIAVNKELENLERALEILPGFLKHKARVCVLSFHSLEDRIVKNFFKAQSKENIFKIITKKPMTAKAEEIKLNPRARSAKLRAVERI